MLYEFVNREWIKFYTYNILFNEKNKLFTCIVYEYAKYELKVLSSHIFSDFEISYVWFQNKIGLYIYIFREISPKLTINKYVNAHSFFGVEFQSDARLFLNYGYTDPPYSEVAILT